MRLFKISTFMTSMMLSMLACSTQTVIVDGYNCEKFQDSGYFDLTEIELETRMMDMDLEKQYLLYQCSMKYVHPPMTIVGDIFAKQGNNIIPMLTQKLEMENSESNIAFIVYLLRNMNNSKSYDVSSDKTLIEVINRKIQTLDDGQWKSIARSTMIEIIQKNKNSNFIND